MSKCSSRKQFRSLRIICNHCSVSTCVWIRTILSNPYPIRPQIAQVQLWARSMTIEIITNNRVVVRSRTTSTSPHFTVEFIQQSNFSALMLLSRSIQENWIKSTIYPSLVSYLTATNTAYSVVVYRQAIETFLN